MPSTSNLKILSPCPLSICDRMSLEPRRTVKMAEMPRIADNKKMIKLCLLYFFISQSRSRMPVYVPRIHQQEIQMAY